MGLWHLGKLDMIVTLSQDQIVPPAGPDEWKDIIVDAGLTEDRYLKANRDQTQQGLAGGPSLGDADDRSRWVG